jgi:hypothetical protein
MRRFESCHPSQFFLILLIALPNLFWWAFFSNLLPEGALRDHIAKAAGIKPTNEFDMLRLLGADLPGAVVAHPSDKALPSTEQKLSLSDQRSLLSLCHWLP